ncbi:MAG: DUF4402 domain-containing protein [Erythrobacter sp.]|uniref:DUF4402 domain-containing protein n=1 Tax=Erythrobacter sp. TaxID=1042 RepID=UPI002607B19E|nr:DUF4402 domain-containing protein [Erythrobacter sp.]MDJ0978467.1 DUF4402 domain-containing protein [Erythrobacter sp.]
MTKTIRFGAAGIAMLSALGMSTAAHADTATADATAEILEALQLDLTDGALDFGAIVVNGADTLTLQANGVMDCANKQVVCSGAVDNPLFTVQGTDGKAVTINLPTASIDLTRVGGTVGTSADTLTVDNFTSSEAGNEVTLSGGSATFTVGGTLDIGATQNAGIYEGTFDVSVDYS